MSKKYLEQARRMQWAPGITPEQGAKYLAAAARERRLIKAAFSKPKSSRGLGGGGSEWLPEGKFTTCALAKKRTESPQAYGSLLKYGLIEVKYVEEASRSRPGQTSCRVYSRTTSKRSHTVR